MERDDESSEGRGAFIALLVATVPVLGLALLRIYWHLKTAQPYPALMTFYSILALFAVTRVAYYLDVCFHYSRWTYYALDFAPVAFVFSAASVVIYLWSHSHRYEISEDFLHRYADFSLRRRSSLYLALLFNAFIFGGLWGTFFVLYAVDSAAVVSVTRAVDISLCVLTAALLYWTSRRMARAITEVLHTRTPRRVLLTQVRAVKLITIFSLLLRALGNVLLFIINPYTPRFSLPVLWAVFLFLFYFLLENCVVFCFLLMVYSQMKHRIEAAREQGESYVVQCDYSDSSFSVSKVFLGPTNVLKPYVANEFDSCNSPQ